MIKKKEKISIWDTVIIGGGSAGLMAAGISAKFGSKTLLIEKNDVMGKKLLLTGGGRCNLTNAEPDMRSFVSKYGKNGSFLFSPFSVFGADDTVRFFESLGLKTKVEPGFRVFPVSDSAMDVLGALTKFAKNNGVEFKLGVEVAHLKKSKKSKLIESIILAGGEEIKAKNFILATGGKSHPETGSTGDGFKWLKEIGHNVTEPNPSLVPIKVRESWIAELAGITLENVGISILVLENSRQNSSQETNDKKEWKKVFNKKGKILFTHEGLSGPTIINMSKMIGDLLAQKKEVKVAIDFFPGVGLDIMHEKMIKLFEANPKKKIKNLLLPEVPEKIYLKILEIMGMDGEWYANEVRRAERESILEKFKMFKLTADSLLGFDKAIVSSGGVDLREVNFKEMKSKIYNNLFLIGDILDFDRSSGGYSLQLCWTSGYIAGKSASNLNSIFYRNSSFVI